MPPALALSPFPDERFRLASAPLFAEGLVSALEWSIDASFKGEPPWFEALLDHYAHAGALAGHAVFYGACDLFAPARSEAWLAQAAPWLARRPLTFLSDHWGALGTPSWRGAPLPPPDGPAFAAHLHDRLAALQRAANCQVGLENLALQPNAATAQAHLPRLGAALAPHHGGLVLDLHNLHCAALNLDLDPIALLDTAPWAAVTALHLSGGRDAPSPHGPIRRDTHDGPVPAALWDLLAHSLPRAPALRFVTLERLPQALTTEPERDEYQAEVRRLAAALQAPFIPIPPGPAPEAPPLPDADPHQAWFALLAALGAPVPAPSTPSPQPTWHPKPWEIALDLVQTWGRPIP